MKAYKIVYYDPETDKYIHQSIKAHGFYLGDSILITFYENILPGNFATMSHTSHGIQSKLVLVLNINNLISIEQVS